MSEPRLPVPDEIGEAFAGKRVLVTGGLGFIGSNVARALVPLGAQVTLMDSMIDGYGGNAFNVADLEGKVRVNIADVRDRAAMDHLVKRQDFLFNLAGQVSHIDSLRDPFTDLDINCRSQLSILESCRHNNRDVKIVFASSRQIYGRPLTDPVDETHPVRPIDVNGINKAAGESYHFLYHDVYGIRSVSLRLTNTYGRGQLVRHDRQGFIGWFVRRAVEGQPIQLYGDGSQRRDLNHVDDVVQAMLLAGATTGTRGKVYNLAGNESHSLAEIASLLVRLAGRGSVTHVPWPPDKAPIDIGSFRGSHALITRDLGWRPTVELADGLRRTVRHYAEHLAQYLD